jgi:acyl-lipid omega-6 desaturase (Delta-12 desaturase)
MLQHLRCRHLSSASQVIGTCVALVLLYVALWKVLPSPWLAACLATAIGVVNVRVFNLMHDCAHRSLFTNSRTNDWLGSVLGFLTLIPYHYWRRQHLRHHATSGNLDRRGQGDIWLLTLQEYQQKPRAVRALYHLYRNPAFYLSLGSILYFAVKMRFPYRAARGMTEWRGILVVTLSWGLLYSLIARAGGPVTPLLWSHALSVLVGGAIGLWLFFVQHQFEHTTWKRQQHWRFFDTAYHGSSFVRLPSTLEWLFVSINLHHIHHLDPKIPNYRLREATNILQDHSRGPLALKDAFRAFRWKLWDEKNERMVGFGKESG